LITQEKESENKNKANEGKDASKNLMEVPRMNRKNENKYEASKNK